MPPRDPQAVILDEEDLRDVRKALRELAIPYCNARDTRLGTRVPLLVSTPSAARGLAAGTLDAPLHQLHVVVCDDPQERAPCDFKLRRPLEPAVLGLLARQSQQGERRRSRRVPLGVCVKLRVDDEEREAVLAQISIAGCGLVSPRPLRAGARLALDLPREPDAPQPLTLAGRVIGVRQRGGAADPTFETSVTFDELELAERLALRALMADRSSDLRQRAAEEARETPPAGARRTVRRHFPRRVLGVRDGNAYLLEGRHLSLEGLGIEAHEGLGEGDRLRLALYTGNGAAPLLLDAEVRRPHGSDGCLLGFGELEPARTEKLLCLLAGLAPAEHARPAAPRKERAARRARC